MQQNEPVNFTKIPNSVFKEGLSCEALGILVYLISKPPGWKIMVRELEKTFRIGRDKRRKIIKELEEKGLLEKSYERKQGGEICGTFYRLKDRPTENTSVGPTEGLKNRPTVLPTDGFTDRRETRHYSNTIMLSNTRIVSNTKTVVEKQPMGNFPDFFFGQFEKIGVKRTAESERILMQRMCDADWQDVEKTIRERLPAHIAAYEKSNRNMSPALYIRSGAYGDAIQKPKAETGFNKSEIKKLV